MSLQALWGPCSAWENLQGSFERSIEHVAHQRLRKPVRRIPALSGAATA